MFRYIWNICVFYTIITFKKEAITKNNVYFGSNYLNIDQAYKSAMQEVLNDIAWVNTTN